MSDAEPIAAIYAHHVLHGTATFDIEPPDPAFWRAKIAALGDQGWPFLVSEYEGDVAAFAYATQMRDRPAYARTAEDSIYVSHHLTGRGLGKLLLAALVESCREAGFEQMIAVVGGGEPASVALHQKLGFEPVGRLRDVGFKFGRRLDTVYLQRDLRR